MLQRAGQQGMPYGIPPVRDGFYHEHRFLPDYVVCFGKIYEWAFVVSTVQVNSALQDKLAIRWDEHVDTAGAYDLQGLQRVGDFQLVDTQIDLRSRGGQDVWRAANTNGHVHLLAVTQESVEVPRAHDPHRHFTPGKLH
jgi:hypothetical protein